MKNNRKSEPGEEESLDFMRAQLLEKRKKLFLSNPDLLRSAVQAMHHAIGENNFKPPAS